MTLKFQQLATLNANDDLDLTSPAILDQDPDRVAEWMAMTASVDRDELIVCPAIRLSRLFQAACDPDSRARVCKSPQSQVDAIEAMIDDAKSREVCWKERNDFVETLAYTPIDVDLSIRLD